MRRGPNSYHVKPKFARSLSMIFLVISLLCFLGASWGQRWPCPSGLGRPGKSIFGFHDCNVHLYDDYLRLVLISCVLIANVRVHTHTAICSYTYMRVLEHTLIYLSTFIFICLFISLALRTSVPVYLPLYISLCLSICMTLSSKRNFTPNSKSQIFIITLTDLQLRSLLSLDASSVLLIVYQVFGGV